MENFDYYSFIDSKEEELFKGDFDNFEEFAEFYSDNYTPTPCLNIIENACTYHCVNCIKKRSLLYCSQCFKYKDHIGHTVFRTTSNSGFCDCGSLVFDNSKCCPRHRIHKENGEVKKDSFDENKNNHFKEIFHSIYQTAFDQESLGNDFRNLFYWTRKIANICLPLLTCAGEEFFAIYTNERIEQMLIEDKNVQVLLEFLRLFTFSPAVKNKFYWKLLVRIFDSYPDKINYSHLKLVSTILFFILSQVRYSDDFFSDDIESCIPVFLKIMDIVQENRTTKFNLLVSSMFKLESINETLTTLYLSYPLQIQQRAICSNLVLKDEDPFVLHLSPKALLDNIYSALTDEEQCSSTSLCLLTMCYLNIVRRKKFNELIEFENLEDLTKILLKEYHSPNIFRKQVLKLVLVSNKHKLGRNDTEISMMFLLAAPLLTLIGSISEPSKFYELAKAEIDPNTEKDLFFFLFASIIFLDINKKSNLNSFCKTIVAVYESYPQHHKSFLNYQLYGVVEQSNTMPNAVPKDKEHINYFAPGGELAVFDIYLLQYLKMMKLDRVVLPVLTEENQPQPLRCREYADMDEFHDFLFTIADVDSKRVEIIAPFLIFMYENTEFGRKITEEQIRELKQKITHPLPPPPKPILKPTTAKHPFRGHKISFVRGACLYRDQPTAKRVLLRKEDCEERLGGDETLFVPSYEDTASFVPHALLFVCDCGGYRECLLHLIHEFFFLEKRQFFKKDAFSNDALLFRVFRDMYRCVATAESYACFLSSDEPMYKEIVSVIIENRLFEDAIKESEHCNDLVFMRRAMIFKVVCLDDESDPSKLDWEQILSKENIEKVFSVSIDENTDLRGFSLDGYFPANSLDVLERKNYETFSLFTDIPKGVDRTNGPYIPYFITRDRWFSSIVIFSNTRHYVLGSPYVAPNGLRNIYDAGVTLEELPLSTLNVEDLHELLNSFYRLDFYNEIEEKID